MKIPVKIPPNTGRGGQESAEEVTPLVMKWLADHAAGDHWFLQVNYWDVHTPMWTVMREGGPFHASKGDLDRCLEHLRKTGREWVIPELLRRHR